MSIFTKYDAVTRRKYSLDLWKDCPREAIKSGIEEGIAFEDDFVDILTGRYVITQATAGTFVLDTGTSIENGVVLADCNSATATQGINVQLSLAAAFKPQVGQDIWFEARIKAADIATGPEFFLGLAEQDTTIIASSAISTANHIGFLSVTDDNVVLHSGEKASAAATGAAIHTFVDDAWVKLGFKVTGLTKVEFWVDGVKQADTFNLAAANIPIVSLTPSIVCQSGGTTDPIVHLDWWDCYTRKY